MRASGQTMVLWVVGVVACGRQVVADAVVARTPVAEASITVAPTRERVQEPEMGIEDAGAAPDPPPPLPDAAHVTVAELVAALELVAVELERHDALKADYAAWTQAHHLSPTDRLWRDYVRVRLVFECVRDGGLWQVRWAITNRAPRSDEIWAQWAKLDDFDASPETATATAECDELSALFAHLVRRLGVENVGLLWPTWNHVVAVWTLEGEAGPVRIVVPTSQIFLDRDASLGTDGFNPYKQKTIYEYRRRDVRDGTRLPAGLARFFIARAWSELRRPQSELQIERNARSDRLGGS